MEKIAKSNLPMLNTNTLSQMASNQSPILNSSSIALKIGEYVQIVDLVGDHYLTGLGMGSNYFSPEPAAIGNYLHSQPFWLYLKGGLIFLGLFYGFIALVLIKKYQAQASNPQNQGIVLGSLIFIALCAMDALTNQFPSLAGSFYLGFWALYAQNIPKKI